MLENLIGKKFGRLTVIEEVTSNIKYRRTWRCKCECGNTKDIIVTTGDLKNGHTQSCGCLQRERVSKSNKRYNRYEFKDDYVIGYTNKEEQFIFDKDDYDKVKNHCWMISDNGYVVSRYNGKTIRFHIVIMGKRDGFVIDHINRKKNDNRKSNLRYATKSQNSINTKKKIKCEKCGKSEKSSVYFSNHIPTAKTSFKYEYGTKKDQKGRYWWTCDCGGSMYVTKKFIKK